MNFISAIISFIQSLFSAKKTETPQNVIILKGETTVIDATSDMLPVSPTAYIDVNAIMFFNTFDFGNTKITPLTVVANPGYQSVIYVTAPNKVWVSPSLVGQLETQNFQVAYLPTGMHYSIAQCINGAINYAKSGVLALLQESVCAKGALYDVIPKVIRPIRGEVA